MKCSSVSFLICRICRIGFPDRPDLLFCKIFMLIAGRHAISCMLELEILFKGCDQLQIVRKRQKTDHAASNCNTLVDKAEVAYSHHAYCTTKRMETVHTSSGVQHPVLTVVAYCVGKDKNFQWGIFDFVSSWWRSRQYSSKTPQKFFERPGQRSADVGKISVECRRLWHTPKVSLKFFGERKLTALSISQLAWKCPAASFPGKLRKERPRMYA